MYENIVGRGRWRPNQDITACAAIDAVYIDQSVRATDGLDDCGVLVIAKGDDNRISRGAGRVIVNHITSR